MQTAVSLHILSSSIPSFTALFTSFKSALEYLHWKFQSEICLASSSLRPKFTKLHAFVAYIPLSRDSSYSMLCNLPTKVIEVWGEASYRDLRYLIESSALDKNPEWPCGRHKVQGFSTLTNTSSFLYLLCLWRRPGAKLSSRLNPCEGQTPVCNICNINVVQFFFRACLTICDMQSF